ncbi:MAG: glucose 1-dehydrogenase [Rhodospirillales bacterium]
MYDLNGRRALITGASRGLGRAIAERLIAEGARVAICSRKQPDPVIKGIEDWQPVDVRDGKALTDWIADRAEAMGGVDILVNNAGVEIEKTAEQTTDDDWNLLTDVNMRNVFTASRAVVPIMRQGGGGAIVNLASISATFSDPGLAIYNASKSWVVGFTKSLAVDHGKDGIRANCVAPGWIMTDMLMQTFSTAKNLDLAIESAEKRHPVGRLGRPEDIARAVAWLVSDEAEFVSGTMLTVDGGLTAGAPIDPAQN